MCVAAKATYCKSPLKLDVMGNSVHQSRSILMCHTGPNSIILSISFFSLLEVGSSKTTMATKVKGKDLEIQTGCAVLASRRGNQSSEMP